MGLLTNCFVEGRGFVHNDCPIQRVLPLRVVSRGLFRPGWVVLDEIDTCINSSVRVSALSVRRLL